jgi:hypothetical protein
VLGTACFFGTDCLSGFCADGVCCDTACGGGSSRDCQVCRKSGGATADGTCTLLPRDVTCRPAAGVCDVAEQCTGTGPDCPVDGFAPATTVCRAASCANGEATVEARCDWHAECPAEQKAACAPGTCGPTACEPQCSKDSECSTGVCVAGVCEAKAAPRAGCGCSAEGAGLSLVALLGALLTNGRRRRTLVQR